MNIFIHIKITKASAQEFIAEIRIKRSILEQKPDATKSVLVECNSYLGYYYFVKEDYNQSKLYWNKILEIDPGNETATKALGGIK